MQFLDLGRFTILPNTGYAAQSSLRKLVRTFHCGRTLCLATLVFWFVGAVASSVLAAAPKDQPWEEIRDSDGILVFRGQAGQSGIYSAKAIGRVFASPRRVASVLLDWRRRKEWFPELIDGYVIKQISPFERLEYMAVRTPFPLSNRDFVYRGKFYYQRESRTFVIEFESIDLPDLPEMPQSDLVRGHIIDSSFVLREMEDGNTLVEHVAAMDPRGSIPTWIVNLVQANVPFNTIANLRRQVDRTDIVELEEVGKLIK